MDDVVIRAFKPSDTQATAQVFYDAVHIGAAKHYMQTQRTAWAPHVPETEIWKKRISAQTAFVAEHQGNLIGFMTLTSGGCIDLAFVAPHQIGRGIAHQLYEKIKSAATQTGLKKLTTEASHLARPFFERQGWIVDKEQSVTIEETVLTNFLMTKDI